jgi:hypothetical protein
MVGGRGAWVRLLEFDGLGFVIYCADMSYIPVQVKDNEFSIKIK